jgi:hypothetical protein
MLRDLKSFIRLRTGMIKIAIDVEAYGFGVFNGGLLFYQRKAANSVEQQ